jgi:hypothetical protein
MSSNAIERWRHSYDADAERRFLDRHGHVEEIAVGTVLEYDDWQWAIVSEIADDREEPKFGFILLDQTGDDIIKRLEKAHGCHQYYAAVEHLRGSHHEYWTAIEYVVEDDIWTVLGPVHPDHRDAENHSLRAASDQFGGEGDE